MKYRLLIILASAMFLSNCSTTPTPGPTLQPTALAAPTMTEAPTSTVPVPPTGTPNVLGLNIIAQYDATSQVLTIYGITPGATVVLGGTPLLPPPTATVTDTPAPTDTPPPTATLPPRVVAPRPTVAPTVAISVASLKGMIVFKSARDGGQYPVAYSFYAMNPDGSGLKRLDLKQMTPLYTQLQSREGLSPNGSLIILGERRCYFGTCNLYMLDTTLNAALINSNDDISVGAWFSAKGFQAKDPVWSPGGNYIAFVSNHESSPGCIISPNIFKGTAATKKPVIRRLTSGSDFCAGGGTGHPSFSPDGAQLAFWNEGSGQKQVYVLNVGPDDSFDFRFANPHIISDHKSDDWDPLWVK